MLDSDVESVFVVFVELVVVVGGVVVPIVVAVKKKNQKLKETYRNCKIFTITNVTISDKNILYRFYYKLFLISG